MSRLLIEQLFSALSGDEKGRPEFNRPADAINYLIKKIQGSKA
jgi:hypothetical protein